MASENPSDVFVTRRLPDPGTEILSRAGLEVELRDSTSAIDREGLERGFAGARAALTMVSDPVDAALLEAAPRLKVVANLGVGYDNIDLEAAAERGVVVTNTPDVLSEATADLAWALILAVARHVVPGDSLVRSGGWAGWAPTQMLGLQLAGNTLGILGMGGIGSAVARRARGFGMRVIYTNRRPSPLAEESGAQLVPFETLIAESDVLSLHAPATEETRGIIGTAELEAMKPGSILINTARGPLVDEAALVAALGEGRIGGAGLDVYEREPEVTAGLTELGNVVLLPHLGSATTSTRAEMVTLASRNIVAVLGGEQPLTPVGATARPADPNHDTAGATER